MILTPRAPRPPARPRRLGRDPLRVRLRLPARASRWGSEATPASSSSCGRCCAGPITGSRSTSTTCRKRWDSVSSCSQSSACLSFAASGRGASRSCCAGSSFRPSSSCSGRSRATSTSCRSRRRSPSSRAGRSPHFRARELPPRRPQGSGSRRHRLVGALVALSLLVPTWRAITPVGRDHRSTPGPAGVPGGREAGRWIGGGRADRREGDHDRPVDVEPGAVLRGRESYGLSVSTNPLHRNPVYEPVGNADLKLRRGEIQYLVWDATRRVAHPVRSRELVDLAHRYHGRSCIVRRVGDRDRDRRLPGAP